MEKYYTPRIEEFHDGFEFEYNVYNEEIDEFTNMWEKSKFDSRSGLGHDMTHFLNDGQVRVKYLDQEDIESLGWKYNNDYNEGKVFKKFTNDKYYVLYFKDNIIEIDYLNNAFENGVFKGTIKNKSELKNLLKQLQII